MWNTRDPISGRRSLFRPSGQLGLVCDGKAICLSVLGSVSFIVVSNFRQFMVYEASTLRLVFVSLPLLCDIRHIVTKFEDVYVVLSNNSLYSFHKYDHRVINNLHTSEIIGITEIDDVLITYGRAEIITYNKKESEDGNKSKQWSPDKVIQLSFEGNLEILSPLICFEKKVLLGYSNGQVQLYDINTCDVVHTFCFNKGELSAGLGKEIISEGISSFVQSQHRSSAIVAIGYKSGYIAIVNIRTDELLGGFQLSNKQKVAYSMVFVYDVFGIIMKPEKGIMASEVLVVGTKNGDIVVFDLNTFRIFSVSESAHGGTVKYLLYIERSNHIVSAGEDNSIIMWALDSDKSFLRELKSRRGFVGEINIMLPYGSDELDILVCTNSNGFGCLGKVSKIQQHQCVNFSTKSAVNKLKKITSISASYQRHYDWPNIVTCHHGTHQVHVWSGHRKALVESSLKVPNSNAVATSVCVTKCGNFVIVGYENGRMHLFNLQSFSYESEYTFKDCDGKVKSAHESQIINISLIGGMQIQSISDSNEISAIRIWNLVSSRLESSYQPSIPHGSSIYLAVCGNILTSLACSDGKIYICDVVGRQIVRVLSYGKRITSMSFHPNGSWFIASADDSTMMVYDVLAACYVDYVKFGGNVLSVNIDSSGSFLNVSTSDVPGTIMQYANRHVFEIRAKTMLYKELSKTPVLLKVPPIVGHIHTSGDISDSNEDHEERYNEENFNPETHIEYKSKSTSLDESLVTLSGLDSGKLQTTLFLDEIKERSKPTEPLKVDEKLPFFIPTSYKDGQLVFVEPEQTQTETLHTVKSRRSDLKSSEKTQADFEVMILSKMQSPIKYDEMMNCLLNQTPSEVHMSLSLLGEERKEESLLTMLNFFEHHTSKRTNSDALQVFLYLFLKFHGEELSKLKSQQAIRIMAKLESQLKNDGDMLHRHFERVSCFIKFFSNLRME